MMFKYKMRAAGVAGAAVLAGAGLAGGSAQAHVCPTHAGAHAAALAETPLKVKALLKLSRNTQSVHEAKGQAIGTVGGTIFLRINVETATRMSAYYVGRTGSSTLTGKGTVKYSVSGSKLHFSGTSSIVQGTGKYLNAYGNGIHLEGTMNRLTEHITMNVSGSFYK